MRARVPAFPSWQIILSGLPAHLGREQLMEWMGAGAGAAGGVAVSLLPGRYGSATERRFLLLPSDRAALAAVSMAVVLAGWLPHAPPWHDLHLQLTPAQLEGRRWRVQC